MCIFASVGQKFSRNDYIQDLVVNEEQLYFNLKYKDEIGYEKTPMKKLCAEKIKKDAKSEEARILYVALTRAIEKLIIIGSVDDVSGFLSKNTSTPQDSFSLKSLVYKADSTLKWLAAILLNPDGSNKSGIEFDINLIDGYTLKKLIKNSISIKQPEDQEPEKTEAVDLTAEEQRRLSEYEQLIKNMYDFKYKKDFLAKIPVKIAVSELLNSTGNEPEMQPLPRFLEEETENKAALKGTAAHIFMQFADYEYAALFGAKEEAAKLLESGFLTEAQHDRIDFEAADKFFASDLYSNIKTAAYIYRETPFLLKVPVSPELSADIPAGADLSGEYTLIQGSVDLFFEDFEGKIYVVDFKTDYLKPAENEQILITRHKRQLDYYCAAAAEITKKQLGGAYIYSFSLNRAVKVM